MGAPAGTVAAPGAPVSGATGKGVEHAASHPRIAAGSKALPRRRSEIVMWVILLEALAAAVILILIVWWTMFSGRHRGERRSDDDAQP
jgi:hypothetical protein